MTALPLGAVATTADAICDVQTASGGIGWYPGGHLDPWDHTQSLMGLTVAGRLAEARRGFTWLADHQRDDGSWAARYDDDQVTDATTDANFCAYPATGLWHHWLATGDRATVREFWPMVASAGRVVLELQGPHGAIAWARDTHGAVFEEYLVTGNASMHLSLRCMARLADLMGEPSQDWWAAAERCARALQSRPDLFTPKPRHAMDWYYPVLGGALVGTPATERIDARWDEFIVDEGCRCVVDHPWVTGAESCELVMALASLGRWQSAERIFDAIHHLRAPDGHYWTGVVLTDGKHWPVEQSTWTSATVLLADDVLTGRTGASTLFHDERAS